MLLLTAELCFSQTYDYDDPNRWTHFTIESGLPSNSVHQLYEARDGIIWAGTLSGIAWYDGFEWQPATFSDQRDVALIGTILGEMNDSILVFVSDGSLALGKKTFRKLLVGTVEEAALLSNGIILVRKYEQLWQIKNEHMSLYTNQVKSIPDRVFLMYPVREGTVLLDAQSGLYKLDNNSLTMFFRKQAERFRLNSVQENNNGNGIVSVEYPSSSRGLWSWNASRKIWKEKSEGADAIVAVAIGADGERIAVYKTGLVRHSVKDIWKTVYDNAELRKTQNVTIGKNNDIWFATTNGIYVYRRSFSRWQYWKHPSPDFRNTCNEIVKTKAGKFWIATANGVDIYDSNGNAHSIESINGNRLFVVTGLAEDSSGNIWISSGSSFKGTYKWDGIRWTYFDPWDSSEDVWIHKIYVDKQKRIWFLGLGKYSPRHGGRQPGVYMYENKQFTHLGEEGGLLSGRVYSFAYSDDSSLWFGTYKGITRLKNGIWTQWRSSNLNIGRAFTIALDHDNRLWFGDNGTVANGLGCIDTTGTIRHLTTDDGMINNSIWDIRVGPDGKIWASTPNGINCYDNGSLISYTEHSGLKSTAGNWPILPLIDNIYVGTTGEGVAILKRNDEISPSPHLKIFPPVTNENEVSVKWKALAYWGEPEPENVNTRYRINSGNWSPWNTVHEKRFNDLAPGEYRLQIQAAGLFGQFDPTGLSVSFVIPPPFYLRPVFYFPLGGLFVTIIGLFLMLHRSKVRRRREIAVSEAKFRAVATTTASGILVFHDEVFMFANHSAEVMTGYEQEELMNKSFWDLIHPEGLSEVKAFMNELLTHTSVSRRFECRILTKMNETAWLDITAARISFMNTPAVIVSAFDITTKKKAEVELVESEERFRLVVESAPNAMVMANRHGLIVLVNSKVEEYFGYTRIELIGGSIDLLIPQRFHEKHQTYQTMYQTAPRVRPMTERELLARRKDGTEFPVEIGLNPVSTKEGNMVLCSIVDITRRKLDEEQKKSLASELVQTEERERRRMAVYLHDIIGYHLTEGKFRLREIIKSVVSQESVRQLKELGQNLDNAIEDSRALTFELSPPVLQDVRFDFAVKILAEQLMTKHNISLFVEHDKLEKPLEPEMKVLLYYAVRELLFNIIKHACATEVKLTMVRTDTEFHIKIEDNGTGFDVNEVLSRNSVTSGFGLKNVYERMGQIGVQFEIISTPLKGTRVAIVVPMKTIL